MPSIISRGFRGRRDGAPSDRVPTMLKDDTRVWIGFVGIRTLEVSV